MNIDIVRKELENLLAREERAKCFYDHYIDELYDSDVRKTLIAIRNEEIKHVSIVKKLLELLS